MSITTIKRRLFKLGYKAYRNFGRLGKKVWFVKRQNFSIAEIGTLKALEMFLSNLESEVSQ